MKILESFYNSKWPPFFLLFIFAIISFSSQNNKSVTVDEFNHLPSGIYNIKTLDWRMNKESPPLIKSIAAFPAILAGSKLQADNFADDPNPWTLGYSFMYGNWEEYIGLFKYGRCAIIFMGCLLGYLIYRFASEIYGRAGGLFSLLLYVLNPNIIAHSSLVTIDIGASCAILLSIYCFWKYLKKRSPCSMFFAGVALGLAQLSKFTALLLYPIFLIIAVVIAAFKIPASVENGGVLNEDINRKRFGLSIMKNIGWFFLIFIISILVINAGYFFSGSFLPAGEYHFSSQNLKAFSSLFF